MWYRCTIKHAGSIAAEEWLVHDYQKLPARAANFMDMHGVFRIVPLMKRHRMG